MTYPQQQPGPQHPPQHQPPQQPQYPQQPHQPPPSYYQQPANVRTVTKTGLPVWAHVLYATLGWIPCFLGWVVWPIHWWFAQKKSVTHTQVY